MKKLLIFIAFSAGYLIMSLELLGFRILAPYFGASIYVWGSLIGLILAALSAGYYSGGWLSELRRGEADKKTGFGLLTKLYLAATLFLLADLFFYSPVLKYLAAWNVIWGALAATLVIFFVPMVLLAAISPIVIKILAEQEKTGRAAGSVYAWGTIGSIFGTFLTSFVLIPYWGSQLTFYSCFFLTLIIFIFLFLVSPLFKILTSGHKRIFLAGLIFLISLANWHSPVLPSNVILETESAYNQIRLTDQGKMISLTLNSRRTGIIQSGFIKDGTLTNFSLIDLFNLGPLITPVKKILVLGMAGGISIRQHQEFSPASKIDAVEIDPKIINIAEKYFGIKESDNLKIYEADARPFLAASREKYDMIEIDLFQGSPYIPFYAATQEFFQSAFEHLNAPGLIMMNVYAPGKKEILTPILATINSVFPSVYTIPIYNNSMSIDNFLVIATRSATNLTEIREAIKNKNTADLKMAVDHAVNFIEAFNANKNTPVFSDNWAPVELISYQMLKGIKL